MIEADVERSLVVLKAEARKYKEQAEKANRELQSLKQQIQSILREITELKSKDSQLYHALSTHASAIDDLRDKLNS